MLGRLVLALHYLTLPYPTCTHADMTVSRESLYVHETDLTGNCLCSTVTSFGFLASVSESTAICHVQSSII